MQCLWTILLVGLSLYARAAVRLPFVTDSWTGTGETNGWFYADHATPYRSDGIPVAVQFAKRGATIVSPSYTGAIVSIELDLRSSTDPARTLELVLLRDGRTFGERRALDPPNAERATRQTVNVPKTLGANGIRLELGAGASGNWGLYGLTLVCLGENEVSAPYQLATPDPLKHTLAVSWMNPDEVVSCELKVVTTNAVPARASWAETITFDCLTNATRQSRDVTQLLTERQAGVFGVRLYTPPASTGIVTIGTSDYAGTLAYRPAVTAPEAYLHVHARRFPSRDEGNVMPVDWTDGITTNALGILQLGDDYAHHFLPLAGVPDAATVLLRSSTNRTTASGANGRVLIDTLGFVTNYIAAHVTTNDLLRRPCHGISARITGLAPGTAGLWSVRGFDANGNASDFAPYIPFRTDSSPRAGTCLHIQ